MGNQKPQIEEEGTMQWPKNKDKKIMVTNHSLCNCLWLSYFCKNRLHQLCNG